MCRDGAFCENEVARKETLYYAEQLPGLREDEVASEKIDSPNSDAVRSTGKRGPDSALLFAGCHLSRGVLPEIG